MFKKLRRITDRQFWLDCVLATAFIFALIVFGGGIFSAFEVLNPIGEAISDMDVTDIVFSKLRKDPDAHQNKDIVIVNIGDLNREGIAKQLEIIEKHEPKVIGVDAFFRELHDPWQDSLLASSMNQVENLVLVTKLNQYNPETGLFDTLETSNPLFLENAQLGFANLITPAKDQDNFKVCRSFSPVEYTSDGKQQLFALTLAEIFNPSALDRFYQRQNPVEFINYGGNIVSTNSKNSEFTNKFTVVDWLDVFEGNFVPEVFAGKVVILGYMGSDLSDTSWDDKLYTPLNKEYAGRTNPDMYGVVVHANILSMILNENFIDSMSERTGLMVGVLLCLLNVICFSLIYRLLPRWYDGLTKSIQLIEALILLLVVVLVFHFFSYKLNLTLGIIAVLFAGDSLEVYYGVLKNLFSKEQRRLLFQPLKD
jgi:CHASE2 domain-containing sensor protein